MAHAEPPAAGDWRRVKLTAELRADAHFGSGVGGGGLDALVARDRDERPVIWASHMEGVLRDAARRLWNDDTRTANVFGRPGGQQQRAVFTSLYAVEDVPTRTWRSSARKPVPQRGPRDETLRFVEHVPRGTRFAGWVELPAGDLPDLCRLVREVDALGTGRAAGAGRVALALEETEKPAPRGGGEAATGRLVLLLRNRDPLSSWFFGGHDAFKDVYAKAYVGHNVAPKIVAAFLAEEGRKRCARDGIAATAIGAQMVPAEVDKRPTRYLRAPAI